MRELAEAFLMEVQRLPGSPEASVAHRVFGLTCFVQGDYPGARVHFEQALVAYEPERDRHLASRFGYDPGVQAMLWLAGALWPTGHVERAANLLVKGLNLALQNGHTPTIRTALYTTCNFAIMQRKPRQAAAHAEALIDLARERGLPLWLARGTFYLGWARWCAGEREGEVGMRRGFAQLRDMEVRLFEPLLGSALAEVEAEAGQVEVGLATLDAQLATIEQTGERWFEAEIYRLRGEFLLRRLQSDATPAESAFMRAIEIARSQQARTFELRAALSLAKLYHTMGRDHAARDLLAPSLVGFGRGARTAGSCRCQSPPYFAWHMRPRRHGRISCISTARTGLPIEPLQTEWSHIPTRNKAGVGLPTKRHVPTEKSRDVSNFEQILNIRTCQLHCSPKKSL